MHFVKFEKNKLDIKCGTHINICLKVIPVLLIRIVVTLLYKASKLLFIKLFHAFVKFPPPSFNLFHFKKYQVKISMCLKCCNKNNVEVVLFVSDCTVVYIILILQ